MSPSLGITLFKEHLRCAGALFVPTNIPTKISASSYLLDATVLVKDIRTLYDQIRKLQSDILFLSMKLGVELGEDDE